MDKQLSSAGVNVGSASAQGPRERNEDFAAAVTRTTLPQPDIVAALADGIGGAKGGRVAAETAVRSFLRGFLEMPESTEVQRAAAPVIGAINSWIFSSARRDTALTGMGCTFTALVLRGGIAHVLHVGDSRAYLLREGRLALLTTDHVIEADGQPSNILTRALWAEPEVQVDYASGPFAPQDRFLLCSDGVHGPLPAGAIAAILREPLAAEETAQALVAGALEAGGLDNATALVIDVVGPPTADPTDLGA